MGHQNSQQEKLFHEMVEYVETMIALGKYPPGSRIPPLRELARQFGLSTGTVARGIKLLVGNNILESRHGSGTFVRPPDPTLKSRHPEREIGIGVFIFNSDENEHYCANALLGVQREAKNHPCRILTRFRTHQEVSQTLLAEAAAENDVILFLGDYDTFVRAIPTTRPAVGLEMHSSFNGLNSTITLDPVDAAETAAEFFLASGCRKVIAMSHPGLVHATRTVLFQAHWRQYGECEIREFSPFEAPILQYGEFDDPEIGHLFVSGTTANRAALEYRDATGEGLAAGRPVLSIDGKSRYVRHYEPMNTIGIDWYEAGRLAFHECLRRIAQPGAVARRIYLHGQLFPFNADRSARTAAKAVQPEPVKVNQ